MTVTFARAVFVTTRSILVLAAGFTLAAAANAQTIKHDIEGLTLDQRPFATSAMKGDVVLVNFWATWCGPCRAEMPALNQYYLSQRAKGLSIIAISMDDSSKRKAVVAAASAFAFPVAMLRDIRLPSALRPTKLPVTLVFDRQGILRFDSRRSKLAIMDGASLNGVLGPLLAEAAGR